MLEDGSRSSNTSVESEEVIGPRFHFLRRLDKKELIILFSYLISIVFIVSFSIYLKTIEKNSLFSGEISEFLGKFFIEAAAPIVIGVSLAVWDRIGLLFPVERGIQSQISDLKQNIILLGDAVKDIKQTMLSEQSQHSDMLRKSLEKFSNISEFYTSRDVFGIHSVAGIEERKNSEGTEVRFVEDYFVPRVFRESNAHEILYLNSFITNMDAHEAAIKDALSRGVNVRMLLARPTKDSRVLRARWDDCYAEIASSGTFDEFIEDIVRKYNKINRLVAEIKKKRERGEPSGSFFVRSYMVSLNHPLILIREKAEDIEPSIAYSGFYLREDAARLPFIEWRPGSFNMISKFMGLFSAKWKESEEWPQNANGENATDC